MIIPIQGFLVRTADAVLSCFLARIADAVLSCFLVRTADAVLSGDKLASASANANASACASASANASAREREVMPRIQPFRVLRVGFAILLVLGLVPALAGCGQRALPNKNPAGLGESQGIARQGAPPRQNTAQQNTAQQRFRTLRVAYLDHPVQHEAFALLQNWAAKNRVGLKGYPISAGRYYNTVHRALGSGANQYDIVWNSEAWASMWARWMLPLDSLPNLKHVEKWQIGQVFRNKEGRPTIVPMAYRAATLFYRKDLLERDDVPESWEELRKTAKKLRLAGKVKHGLAVSFKYPDHRYAWIWSIWANGCDIFRPLGERDNRKLAKGKWQPALTQPCFKEVLKFWRGNLREHALIPRNSILLTQRASNGLFGYGHVAFTVTDYQRLSDFNDPRTSDVANKVGWAPLPQGPSGSGPMAWMELWGWSIPRDSRRQRLALEALNSLLVDIPGQMQIWKSAGGIPPLRGAWEALAEEDLQFRALKAVTLDLAEAGQVFPGKYSFKRWREVSNLLSKTLNQALVETPEIGAQTLKTGQARIQRTMLAKP